jgi:hypothetical protein
MRTSDHLILAIALTALALLLAAVGARAEAVRFRTPDGPRLVLRTERCTSTTCPATVTARSWRTPRPE